MAEPAAGSAGTPPEPQAGQPSAATDDTQTPPPAAPDPEAIRREAEQAAAARFAAQLKELTGHDDFAAAKAAADKAAAEKLAADGKYQELAEQAQQRTAELEARYHAAQVRGAVLGAAGDAVDPEVVLALVERDASVADDGAVTIGGAPAAEAVAALLKSKPYLAKPAGGPGSGAGAGGGGAAQPPKRADFANDVDYHRARAKFTAAQEG